MTSPESDDRSKKFRVFVVMAMAASASLSESVGAAMASIIDHGYDGTVRPLVIAFVVSGAFATALALPISNL